MDVCQGQCQALTDSSSQWRADEASRSPETNSARFRKIYAEVRDLNQKFNVAGSMKRTVQKLERQQHRLDQDLAHGINPFRVAMGVVTRVFSRVKVLKDEMTASERRALLHGAHRLEEGEEEDDDDDVDDDDPVLKSSSPVSYRNR